MSDVFISYARPDEPQANASPKRCERSDIEVWRDDELPAHRAYAEVIEERLKAAKAVVVLWSAEAAKSQWVRAEADVARDGRHAGAGQRRRHRPADAVQPDPVRRPQDWDGDADAPGWRKVEASVARLPGRRRHPQRSRPHAAPSAALDLRAAVRNMSGDAEQEYFSDGISEDITTDLSKVSALAVIARNTAFTFKGQAVDVREVARKLGSATCSKAASARPAAGCGSPRS